MISPVSARMTRVSRPASKITMRALAWALPMARWRSLPAQRTVCLGGCAASQGTVLAGVVAISKGVEQRLQGRQGVGVADAQPAFEGLVEAFDLALGLGVAGVAVLLHDPQGGDDVLEVVGAAFVVGESGGVDQSVVGQGGRWEAMDSCCLQERLGHDGRGDEVVAGDV